MDLPSFATRPEEVCTTLIASSQELNPGRFVPLRPKTLLAVLWQRVEAPGSLRLLRFFG